MSEKHTPYDSREATREHIARVQELMRDATTGLEERAIWHDWSKLEEPEKSIFDRATERLRGLTYGSDEYKASLADMKPALDHHYAANSHHPEHFEDGINGMSLLDLIEMLIDWKAATERHADGDIVRSLEVVNNKRFHIDPQLERILRNTITEFGWD